MTRSNASYVALTDQVFQWMERPSDSAVTSTLTMNELLVREVAAGLLDELR